MGQMGEKRLFLLDMDGTIYLGGKVFPFAVRFINRLREKGYRVLFFTNNASHNPSFYLDKLTRMGFSPCGNLRRSTVFVTVTSWE